MPDLPWWKRGVIYEIPVASFADSDGDGMGDLRGVIGRLDYLTAARLVPGRRRPMAYADERIPDARLRLRRAPTTTPIDPRFGTMADFDELLEACHGRGMDFMTDLVLNHTSEEHPWFVESRGSKGEPEARLVHMA